MVGRRQPGVPRAVASSWYARMLGGGLEDADELIAERLPAAAARAAGGLRALRGGAVWWLAGRDGAIVLTRGEPGALSALVLAAWVGRRRVVLLELIPPPSARAGWRRLVRKAWWRAVERPSVRRVMIAGQVLTERERDDCARLYGIGADRLQYLPWAWSRDATEPPTTGGREGVLAAGRAGCDWPTLFAAAAGRDWPLTVVCGRRDLAAVNDLNADGRARVLCEVPRGEFDDLMRRASVFAMPLEDRPGSAGQVRLMTATQARTPTVASAVPALAGYAVDGRTALLVTPRDPVALGSAIDRLLADPPAAARLADAAFDRASEWTYPRYFAAVRELIENALAGRPVPPRAPLAPE
jgi:glycosyltransferase involved in cell wall biosynthesis